MHDRRKFRREPASQRRDDLIRATLTLIGEQGLQAATVRAIAERANVTQGLIRHYFSTKEDLLAAAYDHHMRDLTDRTSAATKGATTAAGRLAGFVAAGLYPSVADGHAVALWAGFLNMVRHDARMKTTHERTYRDFRDRLEALIGAALAEAGRHPSQDDLRRMAIASNAVIDGLWLEGGALPEAFPHDNLPEIGLQSVGAIIGLNLKEERNAA